MRISLWQEIINVSTRLFSVTPVYLFIYAFHKTSYYGPATMGASPKCLFVTVIHKDVTTVAPQ